MATNLRKVYFSTADEFDPTALTTMGIHHKPNSENPIGHFGTGLKYALAVLSRFNQTVTIEFGGRTWLLSRNKIDFRGKEFEKLSLRAGPTDIIELPFTTELGKGWELWMAFRELYSNTLDENGHCGDNIEKPDVGCLITVTGAEFHKVYENRDKYFLDTMLRTVAWRTHRVIAYHGTSDSIFYRGIAVYKLEKPSEFTYNLLHADLTEDRTLRYPSAEMVRVAGDLVNQDPEIVYPAMTKRGSAEFGATYDYAHPSPEFIKRVRTMAKDRKDPLPPSFEEMVQQRKYDGYYEELICEPTSLERKRLDAAVRFLDLAGFPKVEGFTEMVADIDVLGLCQLKECRIYISKACLAKGIRETVQTLLEERIHAKHGLMDMTRGMQEKLFDLLLEELENRVGEAL